MKSYLNLTPISVKVRKQQNSMTLLCIVFTVSLVTAVFNMANMGVKIEQSRLLEKHGNLTLQDLLTDTTTQTLSLTAGVLFVLILTATVLMVSNSMNGNITQRIKFFGMMRCLGVSRQQIIRFVRLEALGWCKTVIPAGVASKIAATRCLRVALRFIVGEEFSGIPLFGINMPGVVNGVVMDIVTVLLTTGTLTKRATKVSPVTAVSGNSQDDGNAHHTVSMHLFKVETALGVHHTLSAAKNLILMTGSFALSIILFLSFSVLTDFAGYIMPQSAGASDINITSIDGSNTASSNLPDTIIRMHGIKRVYGYRNSFDVSAGLHSGGAKIGIVPYGDFNLDCLIKNGMLREGSNISRVYGNNKYVLTVWDKDSILDIGDKIDVGNEELEIAGLLKYSLFSNNGLTNGEITLATFGTVSIHLTDVADYSLIMIQAAKDVTNENVTATRSILDRNCVLKDLRSRYSSGAYSTFVFCIYAFLTIITLVTVLNIVNNISMSVSSRIKSYGAVRAVGMDRYQITKMIAAEVFTYALTDGLVNCAAGLLVYKLLYDILIISHFSYAALSLPAAPLLIIPFFVYMAVIAAVYAPAKRVRDVEITEVIDEL